MNMNSSTMKRTTEASTACDLRRKRIWALASSLFAAVLLCGCASTEVTSQPSMVFARMPRPGPIYVYDFTASPTEVPRDSAFASSVPVMMPSAEQAEIGRQLGSTIAIQLVEAVREMGLPAMRASPGTPMQVNDIVIRG